MRAVVTKRPRALTPPDDEPPRPGVKKMRAAQKALFHAEIAASNPETRTLPEFLKHAMAELGPSFSIKPIGRENLTPRMLKDRYLRRKLHLRVLGQRGFMANLDWTQALALSAFTGHLPLTGVALFEDQNNNLYVIGGLQRITALLAVVFGRVPVRGIDDDASLRDHSLYLIPWDADRNENPEYRCIGYQKISSYTTKSFSGKWSEWDHLFSMWDGAYGEHDTNAVIDTEDNPGFCDEETFTTFMDRDIGTAMVFSAKSGWTKQAALDHIAAADVTKRAHSNADLFTCHELVAPTLNNLRLRAHEVFKTFHVAPINYRASNGGNSWALAFLLVGALLAFGVRVPRVRQLANQSNYGKFVEELRTIQTAVDTQGEDEDGEEEEENEEMEDEAVTARVAARHFFENAEEAEKIAAKVLDVFEGSIAVDEDDPVDSNMTTDSFACVVGLVFKAVMNSDTDAALKANVSQIDAVYRFLSLSQTKQHKRYVAITQNSEREYRLHFGKAGNAASEGALYLGPQMDFIEGLLEHANNMNDWIDPALMTAFVQHV